MRVKRIFKTKGLLPLYFLLVLHVHANATIKLPAIFSEHMVMQQKAAAPIWGWAKSGEQVTISVSWSAKKISVRPSPDGKWQVMVKTPAAGGPYTILVKGENSIELKDIMIGEVWIASGQSNMGTTLKASDKGSEEVEKANLPNIRYFSVKRQYGPNAFDDAPGSSWEKTSPESAGAFSAVAYFFAKHLQDSLKVPVGIIFNAWGGTPAEAWTPANLLQKDPKLGVYIDRWSKILASAGPDSTAYNLALKAWEKKGDTTKTGVSSKPAEPQSVYYFKRPWREPGVLFNGMLLPVVPFKIKGVLWYQGESNVSFADEYEHLMTTMIESWRHAWKLAKTESNFSFYVVQLAAYGYSDLDAAARLREAQERVSNKVSRSGLAVTVELGDMNDIHFTHKKEVGDRLALVALAKDYNYKKVTYTGPQCRQVLAQGKNIIASFDQELKLNRGGIVNGFEIGYKPGGSDSLVYLKAQARIDGSTVAIWNDKVSNPEMVRYAWLLVGEANLMNEKGLPAHPFRKLIGK